MRAIGPVVAVGLIALSGGPARADFTFSARTTANGTPGTNFNLSAGDSILIDVVVADSDPQTNINASKFNFVIQAIGNASGLTFANVGDNPPTNEPYQGNPNAQPYPYYYIFSKGGVSDSSRSTNNQRVGTASGTTFTGSDTSLLGGVFITQPPLSVDSDANILFARLKLVADPSASGTFTVRFGDKDTNGRSGTSFTRTGDGSSIFFDGTDFSINVTVQPTTNPVPAPAGLLLALTGAPLAGFAAWRRRRPA